jgi:3-phenylpropionate/trans-cinnamate dioxygenase ferredoxin component
MDFIDIARVGELEDDERIFFDYMGIPVVLIQISGEYYALQDCCTHDDGPLGDGEIEDHQIICPRHGARFDVRSGKALTLPAVKEVLAFPVKLVGDVIQVGFPDPE